MSLSKLGARLQDLHGVDLIAQRIRIAQKRYPEVDFHVANAEALSFLDAQFDIVVLFTVFSSILDSAMAAHVANEVSRVLKPGGAILWYDFRYSNPRNPNVRGMTLSAIRALFPYFELKLRSTTLLPPLARRLGRTTPVLYPLLVGVPLLRTHYQGVLIKPYYE
jgi:ubiquinone/menaquinone biosynthesis C-methylase UbiE